MKIGEVDVVETAKATFKDFQDDDLQGLAAEVAYNILFSIVPLLIFLTAVSGFISQAIGTEDVITQVTDWLRQELPASAAQAVVEPVENVVQNQAGGLLSFGAILALWGGRRAVASLIKALNITFDIKETRPWWKKQLVAIGLTILLGLAIVGASAFFLFGSMIGEGLANLFGLGGTWNTVWPLLRWPLVAVLLVVGLAFLYWAGPNVDTPFKLITPGSVLAVVLWVIATFALSFYFRNFAGYTSAAYGALGGVLAFVFWLYVMSLILLLGGELNSVIARRYDEHTQADLAAHPEKRADDLGERRRVAAGEA